MEKTPQWPKYIHDPEYYDNRRLMILKGRQEGQTLKRIGDTWGITRERVGQIIKDELKRRNRGVLERPGR
jgi:DNA-directed RNA polymerase sigma subunit (sigma70/sigma32)